MWSKFLVAIEPEGKCTGTTDDDRGNEVRSHTLNLAADLVEHPELWQQCDGIKIHRDTPHHVKERRVVQITVEADTEKNARRNNILEVHGVAVDLVGGVVCFVDGVKDLKQDIK